MRGALYVVLCACSNAGVMERSKQKNAEVPGLTGPIYGRFCQFNSVDDAIGKIPPSQTPPPPVLESVGVGYVDFGKTARRCLIEKNQHLRRKGWRFIQAAGGEFKYRLHLLPVKSVEPFMILSMLMSSMLAPASIFSKIAETGIRVPRGTHAPLTLPGTFSTAGHCDQSRFAIRHPYFKGIVKHPARMTDVPTDIKLVFSP
jgi:hypothetical protein